MKKVYIETYGCQMNEYDTEIIKSVLQQDNFRITPSLDDADIVLLNTCTVRENADRKVYGKIHSVRNSKNGDPVVIGVLGCMATNFRQDLLRDPNLPINFIAGPDSYKRLPKMIRQVIDAEKKSFDIKLSRHETYSDIYPFRESGVNAWIAVMRGCDNFCTFCVVPYTRGRERSRSPESVIEEAKKLAGEGFRQVTLLGQNVNSYHFEGKDFADLLDSVSEVEGIERIRFTAPHPKDFPHQLLHLLAENPKVCKHIHLPLQSGNDRILRLMNRSYSRQDYLRLVEDIRDHFPETVITTDIIVGFPTETDEEFEDTVKVMEQVEFDSAFIFKYSERPKTIAARKYPDDVPEEAKTERIVHLNELQKKHSLKRNSGHIGEIHEVLIDAEQTKKSEDDFQGRNDGNKIVIVPKGPYRTGQFVNVRINEATANVLKGEVVGIVER